MTDQILEPIKLSILMIRWGPKVRVRHMCSLCGSHDMLILLLNKTDILVIWELGDIYKCS